jgi:hypothetical protein
LPSASSSGSALAGATRGRDATTADLVQRRALHLLVAVQAAAEGGLKVDHVAQKDVFGQSSSRQMVMAWKVSGLSQSPAIIVLRPASIRLAMAISPSRLRSSTEPISRRYMRTGSSVRSSVSDVPPASAISREVEVSTSSPPLGCSGSSFSSPSSMTR